MSLEGITLSDRLASLKDAHDTTVTSKDRTPTPLWVFLYIHTKATNESYRDYLAGAKRLINYLRPLEIPTYKDFKVSDSVMVGEILLQPYHHFCNSWSQE